MNRSSIEANQIQPSALGTSDKFRAISSARIGAVLLGVMGLTACKPQPRPPVEPDTITATEVKETQEVMEVNLSPEDVVFLKNATRLSGNEAERLAVISEFLFTPRTEGVSGHLDGGNTWSVMLPLSVALRGFSKEEWPLGIMSKLESYYEDNFVYNDNDCLKDDANPYLCKGNQVVEAHPQRWWNDNYAQTHPHQWMKNAFDALYPTVLEDYYRNNPEFRELLNAKLRASDIDESYNISPFVYEGLWGEQWFRDKITDNLRKKYLTEEGKKYRGRNPHVLEKLPDSVYRELIADGLIEQILRNYPNACMYMPEWVVVEFQDEEWFMTSIDRNLTEYAYKLYHYPDSVIEYYYGKRKRKVQTVFRKDLAERNRVDYARQDVFYSLPPTVALDIWIADDFPSLDLWEMSDEMLQVFSQNERFVGFYGDSINKQKEREGLVPEEVRWSGSGQSGSLLNFKQIVKHVEDPRVRSLLVDSAEQNLYSFYNEFRQFPWCFEIMEEVIREKYPEVAFVMKYGDRLDDQRKMQDLLAEKISQHPIQAFYHSDDLEGRGMVATQVASEITASQRAIAYMLDRDKAMAWFGESAELDYKRLCEEGERGVETCLAKVPSAIPIDKVDLSSIE